MGEGVCTNDTEQVRHDTADIILNDNKQQIVLRMPWTVRLEGGPRRVNHAAVAVRDKIYSFGGYCTGDDYRSKRPMDVHVLNTVNYRWTVLLTPELGSTQYYQVPYQRYGHTAVVYNDMVYVWGGRNDDSACNILFCFDTNTQCWSRPKVLGQVPGARDGHSACVIDHFMYVFGGYEEDIDQFSQDVHMLDLRSMEWSHLKPEGDPPSYRDFHSATAIGNFIPHPDANANGVSISQGGYLQIPEEETRLMDHNDLFVLDFAPSLKTLTIRNVIEHKLNIEALPESIRWEIRAMTLPNTVTKPLNNAG